MIKRLITDKHKNELSLFKKFKGRKFSELSSIEKEELLELVSKKLGIL